MESSQNNIISLSNDNINELLEVFTSPQPDNDKIKKSTEIIKKYSETLESVEGYLSQIKTNQKPSCRQLASILLYKSIDKHWSKINNEKKNQIKNLIMELYSQEKVYLVLKGIAYVIYKISKQTLLNNEWDDLLNMIFSSPDKYNNEQAYLFELNLHVISDLCNSNMDYLKEKGKLNDIKNILNAAFSMGSDKMKENATQCLGSLIGNLDPNDLNNFKDLSSFVFKEIKKFSEKTILKVYETLVDFSGNSYEYFQKDFDNILPLTIELLNDESYNGNTKSVLGEFLVTIAQFNKKLYTKNNLKLLQEFIKCAFNLISNIENENEPDLYSDISLFKIGLNMINSITRIISSKKTFPILIELIKHYYQQNNKLQRRGSIAIIGEMSEGCSNLMKDNIEEIIDLLINTFTNDPDEGVKGQCIIAMDLLSQYCSPEINEYYDKIIPMLIKGLNSNSKDILEKSLIEINYFCSSVDFELEDYLDMNNEMNSQLLSKLIEILSNSKSLRIQEKTLDALGSVVINAHNLKIEILIPIISTLQQITLNKTTINDRSLIGSALNCIANIIIVIKDKFTNDFEIYFNKFAFECIQSKEYELQFGGLCYFSSLAEIKENNFSNLLDQLMPIIINILNDNSGIVEKNKVKDEFALDSDSEDDMEGNENVYWNEDFINAKCTGIKCLGSFAKSCPSLYINKYFKDTINLLEEFTSYVCDTVLFDVCETYENLLYSLEKAIKENNNLNIDLNEFWVSEIFTHYEELISNSNDQELVSEIFSSIYRIIQHFGKEIFKDNKTNNVNTSLERLMTLTKKLLNNEMTCQIKNEDQDEDEMDHEEDIFDSIKNVCLCLSEKLGDDFHPFFSEIFPLLEKYLKVNRDEEDRQFAFGIIAEVLKFTKISVKFYVKQLFDDMSNNLKGKKRNKNKKNENLFRHISYLIGILFYSDPISSKPYLNNALQMLEFIMGKSKREGKDNVIAALCRIIISMNFNKNNFEFFNKSIENIFANLPFKYDPMENITALEFLIYTIEILDLDDYKKYIEGIMKVLQILVINNTKCETKEDDMSKIKNYLNTLQKNETIKGLIESYIMNKFTPNEKEKFIKCISEAK